MSANPSAPDILTLAGAKSGITAAGTEVSETVRFAGAMAFAFVLVLLTAIATFLIANAAFVGGISAPAAPSPYPSPSDASYQAQIANFKALSDIQLNRFTQL